MRFPKRLRSRTRTTAGGRWRPRPDRLNLALRNDLAEWMLEALEDPRAGERIEALAEFARRCDASGEATLDDGHASRLEGTHFERTSAGLRLKPELAADLPALRDRASRFRRALEAAASDREIVDARERAVRFAEVLFDHALFFEVHEILEPFWLRADGGEREVLQGLIQIAVGFHHAENANRRGALSLLSEGNGKLFRHLPEAFGIDLQILVEEVETFAVALRHGEARVPPTIRRNRSTVS